MTRNSGDYTAGDIKGMNHTDVAIIISSINGYGKKYSSVRGAGVLLRYVAR